MQSGTRTYDVDGEEINVSYELGGSPKDDVVGPSGLHYDVTYYYIKVTVPSGYDGIGFYVAYADLKTAEADATIKDTLDQTLDWKNGAFFFDSKDYDEDFDQFDNVAGEHNFWFESD